MVQKSVESGLPCDSALSRMRTIPARHIQLAFQLVIIALLIIAAAEYVVPRFFVQQENQLNPTPAVVPIIGCIPSAETHMPVHLAATVGSQYKPIALKPRDDLGVKHIGILCICTGKYIKFLQGFLESFEQHFLPRIRKTYFIFTDASHLPPSPAVPAQHLVYVNTKFIGWPYETLYRFHRFNAARDLINASGVEYLFFSNINLFCLQDVGTEVLPGEENEYFVATLHPTYFASSPNDFTYERNPRSIAYIARGDGQHYFQGALYGGRRKEFMEFSSMMEDWVRDDEKRGIIPIWHDESLQNRYLLGRNPLVLPPSYVYPEGWDLGPGFQQLIRSLDKNRHGGLGSLRGLGP